ncbi:50S ribosomal protein L30 [Candidatus Woesearchaeota archaeon]|nr:MAG: 50S ribosomal protein L30 [Candidatus Woesearchaeota archaeon]
MKLAVVRVRGSINLSRDIKDTFKFLGLDKKNSCVVVEDSPSVKGMLDKVKYFVTWGSINDDTISLLEKRGKKNKTFHLNPPRKGFGRKGTKMLFKLGGALGDRGDKINDLIKRML